MISKIEKPSSKHSLARSIMALPNPKLEVFEVMSIEDAKAVSKVVERHSRLGSLSVILVRS